MPLKNWMNLTPKMDPPVQKRPFLRKGTGLRRYYPNLPSQTVNVPTGAKENDKELELFEIMEQMTTCQSFCSTSSVVMRFVNTEINLTTVPEPIEMNFGTEPSEVSFTTAPETIDEHDLVSVAETIDEEDEDDPSSTPETIDEDYLASVPEPVEEDDLTTPQHIEEEDLATAPEPTEVEDLATAPEIVTPHSKSVSFADVPKSFTPPGRARKEKILPNGDIEITYTNGTVKSVSYDGVWSRIKYFNGDIREAKNDGWFKYIYADGSGEYIHYADDTCQFKYSSGQIQTVRPDGTEEMTYPNGYHRKRYPDKKEEYNFNGESTLIVESNGNRTLVLPNGQKEVHTESFRKRIYPNGAARTIYKDGSQETVYPDGRLIMKDTLGVTLYNGYRWNNKD